ncbi:type III pantothenate kinase [Desulfurobacterium thermolithotrophum]|uniref:type III pantothenate kinase n=1 Tax=Desulfurobacterium thermolithotrophum TaxID=64160 RepID=UPI0013D73293|nr:type III pantothenate kinase [Desulfurobacterium thermolithotrophum]
MTDLLIDVGNSFVKTAIWEEGKVCSLFKLSTLTFLKHPELLTEKLKNFHWERVGISSVVKEATNILKRLFPDAVFVSADLKLPIKIEYDNPRGLGADRIANACGGLEFGRSFAIVSVGTAVVVDLVENQTFKGGVIFPGLKIMAETLSLKTSQLPKINEIKKIQIPGRSTRECIESGILLAVVGGIKEALNTYNIDTVLMTGGNSSILKTFIKNSVIVSDLTFKGIKKILDKS